MSLSRVLARVGCPRGVEPSGGTSELRIKNDLNPEIEQAPDRVLRGEYPVRTPAAGTYPYALDVDENLHAICSRCTDSGDDHAQDSSLVAEDGGHKFG